MSFNLSINFDTFEDLESFVNNMNKYKVWKNKQEKKKGKQINQPKDEDDQHSFIDEKRGIHIKAYHNEAKIYQNENPALSYRECLAAIYKKNKNVEKIL